MWSGSLSVLLRPTIFIQRPRAWLEHISSWGGTITSAPNFAYERLCEMFQDGNKEGLDLSSLVNVVIGGEPVSKETLDKLLLTLKDCGLSPESLAPSYGMAEATLLISSGRRKGGPVYSSSHSDFPVTGLGSAVKGLNVVLRDQETLETKSPGELGEIWISGDCVGQVIPLESDWRHREGDREIRTGDFGYFENDSLFITGRNVNKIIVRGRNVFAEDVEFLTRQSQLSGFCAGVAAFGIDEGGSQNLCILIEDNRSRRLFDIKALNEIVQSKLGVKPYQIVLLKRATLPRTSSGKIKRGLAKEQFLSHKYEDRVI
jgi:acyl-CoA synthetase (AMP-forming)/AMP-acid ligase II